MEAKQTCGDTVTTAHGENIDYKVAEILPKKYADFFQYRVSFEPEWKVYNPMKTIESKKCKFHCLSYKKTSFLTIRKVMIFSNIKISC